MAEKETALELERAVGGTRIRLRVNLTHNSKGTNVDTTAEVEAESPEALNAVWGDDRPSVVIAHLLRFGFLAAQQEAIRRGKPVEQIPPLEGFAELPPLSEIDDPNEVPF